MEATNKSLLDAIRNHKVVVITDIPDTSSRNNEITKQTLISELKRKLQISSDLSFEQLIDYGVRKQGRENFIATLNRAMNNDNVKPPLYYQLFESVGIKYIIEAHFSPLYRIEVNESEKSQHYSFYSRDEDFSFDGLNQIVVSLFGDTEYQKNKVLLTQNDYNGFLRDSNSMSSSLLSILKNTILFVDFNPNSDRFKSIYDFICQKNCKYPSEAFLVTTTKQGALSYGKTENLTIIDSDAYEYIREIHKELKLTSHTFVNETGSTDTLPSVPYKYLHSFEQSDSAVFFGRETEISELCLRVRGAKQIAMLTSLSGYGKTSLINAGLIPSLKKTEDYDVFYVRSGRNPWQSLIINVFKKTSEEFDISTINVKDLFSRKYQLVILDQFEECFVEATDEEIKQIDAQMKTFLETFPTFSLLISIRQDFFTYLTKFRFLENAQINSTYNLSALSQFNARDAIQKPAEIFGFSFENELVDRIIHDLSTADGVGEPYIDPSQLQIVCYFLYQEITNRKQKIITANIYDELGRANGILDNYIDDSLKNLSERNQILGKDILKCLVSSKKTRMSKNQHAITTELASNTENDFSYSNDEIKYMLDYLINARLLRTRTVDDNIKEYELTHEYIIRKINEWMDVETLKFKEICELFKAEFRKWTLGFGTLMQQNLYNEVWKYKTRIAFTDNENAYILLCIIGYNDFNSEELKYWTNMNKDNAFCESSLKYAMDHFKGKKRIRAGLILSVVLPKSDVYHLIASTLANSINPYLSDVEIELSELGVKVDDSFFAEMNKLLHQARTKDMCIVSAASNIKLGLSVKQRENVIRKYGIEKNMKPFFPNGERIADFETFRIDTYTVTNSMYAEYDENYQYKKEQADYPVTGINFEQAMSFAHWWGKDLPTEDEWEYAARGNDFRHFPWGNEWDYESEKEKQESDKLCNTSLTGTDGARSSKEYAKGVSPWGCYNMSGNVWEWTKTEAPDDNNRLIIKGGSWSRMGILPWTWYRYTTTKASGQQNIGFRCILRGEV